MKKREERKKEEVKNKIIEEIELSKHLIFVDDKTISLLGTGEDLLVLFIKISIELIKHGAELDDLTKCLAVGYTYLMKGEK